jgi:hypothetical protein
VFAPTRFCPAPLFDGENTNKGELKVDAKDREYQALDRNS